MNPAAIKIITIACFLYFFKNDDVKILILVKKYTNTGNSKTKPIAKVRTEIVEIYEPMVIWFLMLELNSYVAKKLMVNGAMK